MWYFMFFTHTIVLVNIKKYNSRIVFFDMYYYFEVQGLLSQFKDFSRLYANSMTFQDKKSNSRAFQYCMNPVGGFALDDNTLVFNSQFVIFGITMILSVLDNQSW